MGFTLDSASTVGNNDAYNSFVQAVEVLESTDIDLTTIDVLPATTTSPLSTYTTTVNDPGLQSIHDFWINYNINVPAFLQGSDATSSAWTNIVKFWREYGQTSSLTYAGQLLTFSVTDLPIVGSITSKSEVANRLIQGAAAKVLRSKAAFYVKHTAAILLLAAGDAVDGFQDVKDALQHPSFGTLVSMAGRVGQFADKVYYLYEWWKHYLKYAIKYEATGLPLTTVKHMINNTLSAPIGLYTTAISPFIFDGSSSENLWFMTNIYDKLNLFTDNNVGFTENISNLFKYKFDPKAAAEATFRLMGIDATYSITQRSIGKLAMDYTYYSTNYYPDLKEYANDSNKIGELLRDANPFSFTATIKDFFKPFGSSTDQTTYNEYGYDYTGESEYDPIQNDTIEIVSQAASTQAILRKLDLADYATGPFFDSLWLVSINDIPAAFYDPSRPAYKYLTYIVEQKLTKSTSDVLADIRRKFINIAKTRGSTDAKRIWLDVFRSHLTYLARSVSGLPEFSVQSQTIDGPTRKFSLPGKDGTFAQGGKQLTVNLLALQNSSEILNVVEREYAGEQKQKDLLSNNRFKYRYAFNTYELFYLMRQAVSTVDGITFYPYDYLIDSIDVGLLTPKKNVENVFRFYDVYVSNVKITENLTYTPSSDFIKVVVTFTYNYVEVLGGFPKPIL